MKKTLIVVDMQKDFIDGSLGTKEAEAIVGRVRNKIEQYRNNQDEVIFTRDTHQADYLETNEGRHLPVVHCVKGTSGWQIDSRLDTAGCEIIDKPAFGYTGWAGRGFQEIELAGLCTDICVVSNALILKALYPEIPVSVDARCCAGVTPESHRAALDVMQMCQVDVTGRYYFNGNERTAEIHAVHRLYPGIDTPMDLYDALSEIWCADTCAPRMRSDWTPENRTLGQCSITAFLAQDIFGGEVYGMPSAGGGCHCYNVVDGIAFDLASEQYGEKAKDLVYTGNVLQHREDPHHFGKEEKRLRYEYLRNALRERLDG